MITLAIHIGRFLQVALVAQHAVEGGIDVAEVGDEVVVVDGKVPVSDGIARIDRAVREAMLVADSQFSSAAEEATREGSDWNYAAERSHLQSIMNDMAGSKKKWMDVQMKSAEKQSTAMSFLHQQQQMIQQLQMQLYGQTSPWNVGMAYRVPDTNFNLQGSYQQGRANVQLSCVPDEYAPMLGQNGFTNGVGPGNLGLSLNLSV